MDVPGAHLYFEFYGDGPLLVLVPGAAGSAEPYRMIAACLAPSHTVVAYDRRGFSRSNLDGEQDYSRRIDTDADDVAAIIDHLDMGTAAVFGNSSGAIVALQVLTRHPAKIHKVIAHEPPLLRELSDGEAWIEFFSTLYELQRQSGGDRAMALFRERTFPETDGELMARAPTNQYSAANSRYWFEHELRQYPAQALDHRALKKSRDALVLAVGRDSQGFPCYEATWAIGKTLGREPVEMPGGHLGFISHPKEFAQALMPHI